MAITGRYEDPPGGFRLIPSQGGGRWEYVPAWHEQIREELTRHEDVIDRDENRERLVGESGR